MSSIVDRIVYIFSREREHLRIIVAAMRSLQRAVVRRDVDDTAHITAQLDALNTELAHIEVERVSAVNDLCAERNAPAPPGSEISATTLISLVGREQGGELQQIVRDIREYVAHAQVLSASINRYSRAMDSAIRTATDIITANNGKMYQSDGSHAGAEREALLCDHKR